MNNGGYTSQDPTTLGSKVEELVRTELGSSAAVPFEIIGADGEGKHFTAGSLLADTATHLFGGKTTMLCSVGFQLTQPRVIALQVQLDRVGVGAHLGTLLYSTRLAKRVLGDVTLEDPKTFASKFVSPQDPGAADRLNAEKDLIKRVNKFARAEFPGFNVKGQRIFQIKPEGDGGANLIAATFPRSYAMGFKVSLDVKEFVDLAGTVEAAL